MSPLQAHNLWLQVSAIWASELPHKIGRPMLTPARIGKLMGLRSREITKNGLDIPQSKEGWLARLANMKLDLRHGRFTKPARVQELIELSERMRRLA